MSTTEDQRRGLLHVQRQKGAVRGSGLEGVLDDEATSEGTALDAGVTGAVENSGVSGGEQAYTDLLILLGKTDATMADLARFYETDSIGVSPRRLPTQQEMVALAGLSLIPQDKALHRASKSVFLGDLIRSVGGLVHAQEEAHDERTLFLARQYGRLIHLGEYIGTAIGIGVGIGLGVAAYVSGSADLFGIGLLSPFIGDRVGNYFGERQARKRQALAEPSSGWMETVRKRGDFPLDGKWGWPHFQATLYEDLALELGRPKFSVGEGTLRLEGFSLHESEERLTMYVAGLYLHIGRCLSLKRALLGVELPSSIDFGEDGSVFTALEATLGEEEDSFEPWLLSVSGRLRYEGIYLSMDLEEQVGNYGKELQRALEQVEGALRSPATNESRYVLRWLGGHMASLERMHGLLSKDLDTLSSYLPRLLDREKVSSE